MAHSRAGWRSSFVACFATVCLLLPAAAARAQDAIDGDIWHTLLARTALAKDEQLSPLNLGVRVRNRVATLWGAVPSPELAKRAVERLKALEDLREVRNQMDLDEEGLAPPRPAVRPPYLPESLPDNLSPAAGNKPK